MVSSKGERWEHAQADREQIYKKSAELRNCENLYDFVKLTQGTAQTQAENEDTISREAVLENTFKIYTHECGLIEVVGVATIENLPSVKPQKTTGHWIAQDIHNCHTDFKCSECGYIHNFMHLYGKPTADYTYCPSCGAKMIKSQESEED